MTFNRTPSLKHTAVLFTTLAAMTFAGSALADRDDAQLLEQTKITLSEAIAIAEKHQNGRAYEASVDDDRFSPSYEVSVAAGDRLYELDVDGVTGEVRNVREERD